MMDGEEFSTFGAAEHFSYMNTQADVRKKKNKNKRRFDDEQIKSLETIFESESRLEPRKKMQLARELGLQPRQVAIWFQNKRARYKSKQLESEYSILQANYKNLASQFDALKKEKQGLMLQLEKLKDMMHKSEEQSTCCKQEQGINNSIDHESDNGDHFARCESEVNPAISLGRSDKGLGVLSDDDSSIKAEYFGLEEEPNLMRIAEPFDGSSTSSEDWGNLDTKDIFDQSSGSYQWWNFWS